MFLVTFLFFSPPSDHWQYWKWSGGYIDVKLLTFFFLSLVKTFCNSVGNEYLKNFEAVMLKLGGKVILVWVLRESLTSILVICILNHPLWNTSLKLALLGFFTNRSSNLFNGCNCLDSLSHWGGIRCKALQSPACLQKVPFMVLLLCPFVQPL